MNTLGILLTIVLTPCAFAWDLNDVSILMPLTISNELIKADDSSLQGPLFSRKTFEKVGILSFFSEDSAHTYENLRALSFRFDPCPAEQTPISYCRPEVRIVWQPAVRARLTTKPTTEDAALHSFYRLDAYQYKNFKAGLLEIKNDLKLLGVDTDSKPLGVHPAFINKISSALFLQKFKALVFKNISEKNMYRFTFMKLLAPDNWWKFFAGFELNTNGQWVQSTIPRHGGTELDIINDSTEVNPKTGFVDEVDIGIFVMGKYRYDEDLRFIVSSGYRQTFRSISPEIADLPQFREKIGVTHRFQNPKFTNPHNLDCVGCHISNTAQLFATKVFPELKPMVERHLFKYPLPNNRAYDTSNTSVALKTSKSVRAFGYLHDEVSIMTRTIHDSVESAEYLNLNSTSYH